MIRTLTLILVCFNLKVCAQNADRLITLENRVRLSTSPEQKTRALLDLAEYYSIYKREEKADSLLNSTLSEAEIANDKELILQILFNNNVTNLSSYNSIQRFERTEEFIKKGLAYALETGKNDFVLISYIQLSRLNRFRGRFAQALEFSNKAFTAMGEREPDSLKCALYIETGDNYASRPDPVSANNNYNNAFEIAYELKNKPLLSKVYHRLSELYSSLGKTEEARQQLLKSLELNKAGGASEELYQDYYNLARLTGNKSFIESAIRTAQDCGSERSLLAGKRLLFSWHMVKGGDCSQTFAYFNANPDMVQTYMNLGTATYYVQIGNIYLYCNRPDSARYYFTLALNEFDRNYDDEFRLGVYLSLAQAYSKSGEVANSIEANLKAMEIAKRMNNTRSLALIADSLANLYARQNNFAYAYEYKIRADSFSVHLDELLEKDKLAVLEIERENSRMAADKEDLKIRTNRKHNLQLMGITIFLTVLFAFMLLLGMFNVSKTMIRLVGYFAFISLFEFIIVLIEKPLSSFTHHEPLKVWSIKIVLIAMLVPIQHFLETRLIAFLQSRKLLEAKRNFFARRKVVIPAALNNESSADLVTENSVKARPAG